jgi:hypothetical protein
MSAEENSRRQFLVSSMTGISTAWLALNWPAVVRAQSMAHQKVEFAFFKPEQAAEIDAMAAQIFPSDDTPGAREAQVINFIDLALVTFATDAQPIYAHAAMFSALKPAQQIQLLTSIEKTPFFKTVRDHTIMGVFASPQHGGNYDKVGWKLIGFEDKLAFAPPFGYYDR